MVGGKKKTKPPANPSNPENNIHTNPATNAEPELNPTNHTNPLAQEENGGDPAKGSNKG